MSRLSWILILAAVLAIVLLLRTTDTTPVDEADPLPSAQTAEQPTRATVYTDVCTLAVKVVDEGGHHLVGVTAGFRALGEETIRQTDHRGEAVFSRVPAGLVEVFARAPDRNEVSTRRPLPAGLRSDVRLTLVPERE